MQQNMMLLLVVLVIVVVVVVAAVLMSSGGQQAPTPGPAPGQAMDSGNALPAGQGTAPAGQGTPPAGGSGDLANALSVMSSGSPAVCVMTIDAAAASSDPSLAGMVGTMTMKIEGDKSRIESNMQGFSFTVIGKGNTAYMTSSMMGGKWYRYTSEDNTPTMQTMSPQEIENMVAQGLPEGVTLTCNPVADIPDSEFELPAGAEVANMSELANTFFGSDMNYTLVE